MNIKRINVKKIIGREIIISLIVFTIVSFFAWKASYYYKLWMSAPQSGWHTVEMWDKTIEYAGECRMAWLDYRALAILVIVLYSIYVIIRLVVWNNKNTNLRKWTQHILI